MARQTKKTDTLPSPDEIKAFINKSSGSIGKREIARAFGIKGSARIALKKLLRKLASDGEIVFHKRKRINPPGSLPPVTVLEVTEILDDGLARGRPVKHVNDTANLEISIAINNKAPSFSAGDRVLVKTSRTSEKVYKAFVLRKLDSDTSRTLGIINKQAGHLRVLPIDGRKSNLAIIDQSISIPAREGDLVEVEIQRERKMGLRQAKVTEVIGQKGERNLVSLISIHEHNIPTEFSQEALNLAESAAPIELGKDRNDLRDIDLITVDGKDARDFDDAIWAEEYQCTGTSLGWRLIVAIADVAHYVRQGDALDTEAKRRGNSVYFPDRVIPMLPEALSNGLCSLKPNEDRGCLAVEMIIDSVGNKQSHRFIRGIMRSRARVTYEELEKAFHTKSTPMSHELKKFSSPLLGAFRALSKARERRGALNIETTEKHIEITENGMVESITPRDRLESHKVIEEFMILANICAAETLEQRKYPCVYRTHDAPSDEKVTDLRSNLEFMGIKLSKGQVLKPKVFNQILSQVKETDFEQMVNQLVLRSQSQAEYSVTNIGHFGLGLSRYAHFTSPIRRYSDLLVHRALITANTLGLGGQTNVPLNDLEVICNQISQTERRAASAERSANDRYAALFMENRIGESFDAVISGVKNFGIFITLNDVQADALLPVSSLPNDYYEYDEKKHLLIGRNIGLDFRLGQKIHVTLKTADPITGRLAVEYAGGSPDFTKNASKPRRKRKKINNRPRKKNSLSF